MSIPRHSSIALWLLIVVLASVGQLAFKAAASDPAPVGMLAGWLRMLHRPWIWVGIGSFVLQFVLWIAFLSLIPLSLGMMLASFEIVVVYVAGRVLFNEPGSWLRVTGVVLISAGVAIVAAIQ
jgi:drug/metabolite transporter (DMT)-like permease